MINSRKIGKYMKEISGKYPGFQKLEIDAVRPVYYPIALIELDMSEKVFEDFDMIQRTILRFLDIGVTESITIARSTGLSQRYVENVRHLLEGYGLWANGQVTDTGKESLKSSKRIMIKRVRQQFQLDPVNNVLLRVPETISEGMINSSAKVYNDIGIVDYCSRISTETVLEQFRAAYQAEQLRKSKMANVNILEIHDAVCAGIEYASALMICLKGVSIPLIFSERYNAWAEKGQSRYSWTPFYTIKELALLGVRFEDSVRLITREGAGFVAGLKELVINLKEKPSDDVIFNVLKRDYAISDKMILMRGRTVWIKKESFMPYRKKVVSTVLELLMALKERGSYMVAPARLEGDYIEIRTGDPRLLNVADILCKTVKALGFGNTVNRIREFDEGEESGEMMLIPILRALEKYQKA